MQMQWGCDVRIETKQDDGSWWGLIYVFQHDRDQPPLLVGPCEDEASALERAQRLAKDVAPPSRDFP